MMKFIVFFFLLSLGLRADSTKTNLEKKVDQVELDDLKDILIKDKLYKNAQKRKKTLERIKKARKKIQKKKSFYPSESEFWEVSSEYWLVKNAPLLKWDFDKPVYGIGVHLRKTLLQLGFVEKKIKIIYSKNDIVPHFALPSSAESYIFVLSIPFIKTMDLKKKEISMLLLEDLIRLNKNFFKKNIRSKGFKSQLGKEIVEKDAKKRMIAFQGLIDDYSDIILNRGYTFQQQFEVTKKMSDLLKPYPEYWNAYYQLCKKRDFLTQANTQYKKYMKIYPSPIMQLSWLKPKKATSIP